MIKAIVENIVGNVGKIPLETTHAVDNDSKELHEAVGKMNQTFGRHCEVVTEVNVEATSSTDSTVETTETQPDNTPVVENKDNPIQTNWDKVVVVGKTAPQADEPAPISQATTSFEEVLQVLATNGNFIDGQEGEVIRVRKDTLYGFITQGKATLLLPEVVGVGDVEGDVVVNSVELSAEVRDGKTTIVPRLGKQYFVSTGHPLPEVLNEDCIRLHNQVLRATGWEGINSPIPSRAIMRKEIQTAGFLTSLADV